MPEAAPQAATAATREPLAPQPGAGGEPGLARAASGDSKAQVAGLQIFVYYRVAETRLGEVLPLVAAFQRELPGPAASPDALMRRPGSTAGLVTLMETYRLGLAATGDASLRARIAAGPPALAPWLHGPRHVEEFMPCA